MHVCELLSAGLLIHMAIVMKRVPLPPNARNHSLSCVESPCWTMLASAYEVYIQCVGPECGKQDAADTLLQRKTLASMCRRPGRASRATTGGGSGAAQPGSDPCATPREPRRQPASRPFPLPPLPQSAGSSMSSSRALSRAELSPPLLPMQPAPPAQSASPSRRNRRPAARRRRRRRPAERAAQAYSAIPLSGTADGGDNSSMRRHGEAPARLRRRRAPARCGPRRRCPPPAP